MVPKLLTHLKTNNCENADDKFGRLNGKFYRNWVRQDNTISFSFKDQIEKHF